MAENKMNAPSNPMGDSLVGDSLERSILRVLENAPRVNVPDGFAIRVAGQLPPRGAVVLTPMRYGRRAAVGCLVLLVILMIAFAHRAATGSSLYWSSFESVLCLQFALLAVWLVVRDYLTVSNL